MTRPRFLANHDFNERIIEGVWRREPAVEFLKARMVGLKESSDPDILAWAAREQLIVVSHDVNTMSAAAASRLDAGEPMSGLLLVHQRYPLAPIIDDLVLLWSASEAHEWMGKIQFLPV